MRLKRRDGATAPLGGRSRPRGPSPPFRPDLRRTRSAHLGARRRRLPGVAHLASFLGARPRRRNGRQPGSSSLRHRARDLQPGSDQRLRSTHAATWEELSGRPIATYVGDLTEYEFVEEVMKSFRPDAIVHFGEQRSAPVLDDRPLARRVHAGEQRRREPQPALRDRPDRPVGAPGEARNDGRVRDAEHRHRRGLHRHHAQRPHRHAAVPQATGVLLPPVEGARLAQHRVRVPYLGAARHRPQPGHRLRTGDRRDRAAPGPRDPLRLRRGVRHRAQPVHRAGRRRPPAHRLRQGQPDARHAQHQGHARLRRAGGAAIRRRSGSTACSTSSPSRSPST